MSLATSGMYLGSAGAMAALPGWVASRGPGSLLRVVACLGFAWLAAWALLGRDVANRRGPMPPQCTYWDIMFHPVYLHKHDWHPDATMNTKKCPVLPIQDILFATDRHCQAILLPVVHSSQSTLGGTSDA